MDAANSGFIRTGWLFTVKEEQRLGLKAFLSGQRCFTFFWTDFGKNFAKCHMNSGLLTGRVKRLIGLLECDIEIVHPVWLPLFPNTFHVLFTR